MGKVINLDDYRHTPDEYGLETEDITLEQLRDFMNGLEEGLGDIPSKEDE